ncbi:MAG TPA: hypothetical protein VGE74_20860 [Gemmata sp.]
MATAPSPNDLTRQQLDELDALLQKMLTVPLAPAETPPPAATLPPIAQPPLPPSWRIDPPAPAPSLAHLASTEPEPTTLKFEPPAPPPAPAPAPAAKKEPAPAPAPHPKPVGPTVTAPKSAPARAPKPVVTAAPLAPAPAAPPVPLVAIPFVAVNGLFDSTCGMFGPPGRLFRSGFFKQIYGLIGLGLVVYTGLHVGQVQGWLTLPVSLPWPK